MAKRTFDFVVAALLLIITFPLMLIFGIILFIELKQFPLFVQERGLTLNKHRFKILKLRTIKKHSSHKRDLDKNNDIFLKPFLAEKITPFAKWLRRTGLDEIPQLFNVILGQMSLIGPRPLMIHDLQILKNSYPNFYNEREKLTVKPGISGLWQLFGNRNEGVSNLVYLDYLYEKYFSFKLDLILLLHTLPVITAAKNSDAIFNFSNFYLRTGEERYNYSSKLKISLNLPVDVFDLILATAHERDGKYVVEVPETWWYVSNSLKNYAGEEKNLNIFDIDSGKKASEKKKTA